MTNIEYPRLCGGTFMTLVIQALLQRKKAREHYKGESDKLNDPDVLVGLITVINPDYEDPGKAVLKTKANDYKSCKLSKGQYLPFGDKLAIEVFDQRVRDNYLVARNDMCIFVDSFIETGTKLQKDVRLVKALIDLIEQDESIDDSVEFMVGENGDAVRKDQLRNLKRVCLPSFLLGIWHFIVINRKNNKVGQLTYDTWCPENGGGTREYEGTMGDGISIEFDVYTLEPEDETEDTEQEAEVVEDQPERNNQDNQNDHRETSGTGPNLQQINNPFTFIQNGDNNTQIGYIANQTIVKK
ncbi:hypothetical protein [Hornefia butyriciproducens]|uniref:hypothetical protein n=1 Tax=Hornefia butyriciproducens TaxID=2652293 RepID=UPI003F8CD7C9